MPNDILPVLFIVAMVFFALSRYLVERIEHNHYRQRADFFHHYPVREGDIVFLGDSITDGGAWEELFPGVPLKNRGINADDTIGVCKRMDDILLAKPVAIFLLIGTNDLPWVNHRSNKEILQSYNRILDRCKELSPGTVVYVQSILPRTRTYAKRIPNLNSGLKDLAERHGFPFINLYQAFVDAKGCLQDELTNDHLHLMAAGYARWVQILQPYVDEIVASTGEKAHHLSHLKSESN